MQSAPIRKQLISSSEFLTDIALSFLPPATLFFSILPQYIISFSGFLIYFHFLDIRPTGPSLSLSI